MSNTTSGWAVVKALVYLGLAISLGLCGLYYIFAVYLDFTGPNIGIAFGVVVIYLVIAYVFTPMDVDEDALVPWNNPFTFKDDEARFALTINIVMIPGIVIINSVATIIYAVRGE